MAKYDGKTLLVLGSNTGAVDLVLYARENGAKTIVADYFPTEESAAKKVADVALLISTAEIDQLCDVVKEYQVDGILSGISEFNLMKAMEVSKRCSLPFYCNMKQWEMVEHKDQFRELCEKYEVPCPKTYYRGGKLTDQEWKTIGFPSVIKPVDACTSAGVHICHTLEEMRGYENDSLQKSDSGKLIIEEFVKGEEFTAHYTISNRKAVLSCMDNRYPVAVHEGNVTTIPIARVYPSTFLDEYISQVNPYMINLCEGLGMENGIVFIQGLYDKESNEFHIFEAGLRSAGEAPYRFIKKINGTNPMNVLVDHALSVKNDYDLNCEDPYLKGKCCGVVSFVAKGGKVGSIDGLDEAVEATPSVVAYESRYPVGTVTPDGDTLRQLMIRFVMICESRERMAEDVDFLNANIEVKNDQGDNMVLKMNTQALFQ